MGSWARGTRQAGSDLDLVLLTAAPGRYTGEDGWLGELGGTRLVRTRTWGAVTERRFTLGSGLEVDLCVGRPDWASVAPLDDGTRRVAAGGLRPVYDPDGVLASLVAAVR